MKISMILTSIAALFLTACNNQNSNNKDIIKTVLSYVAAGDHRNTDALKEILHPEYRALANRVFDSEELQVISRDIYLKLMSDGTIGGDRRKVKISETEIVGHNAYVHATLTGKTAKFNTFVLLAQNTDGNWKVVSDMPFVENLD